MGSSVTLDKVLAYGVGDRARVGGRLGFNCGRDGCKSNGAPRCVSPSHLTEADLVRFFVALSADESARLSKAASDRTEAAAAALQSADELDTAPEGAEVLNDFQKAVLGALGASGGGKGSFWSRVEKVAAAAAAKVAADAPVTRWEVKRLDGTTKDVGGLKHPAFARLMLLAKSRENAFLVGPSGCGKSVLAKQVADALGMDFYTTSFSAGTSESAVVGRSVGLDSQYRSSEFVKAYENAGKNPNGSVWFGDEICGADANCLLNLNGALAGDTFPLDKRTDAPYAKRDPKFWAIVADNTAGTGGTAKFTARNRLDTAFLDRFRIGMTFMDYDPAIEKSIADAEVYAYCTAVREVCRKAGIDKDITTRYMAAASRVKANGGTKRDWASGLFVGWKPDELAKVPKDLIVG